LFTFLSGKASYWMPVRKRWSTSDRGMLPVREERDRAGPLPGPPLRRLVPACHLVDAGPGLPRRHRSKGGPAPVDRKRQHRPGCVTSRPQPVTTPWSASPPPRSAGSSPCSTSPATHPATTCTGHDGGGVTRPAPGNPTTSADNHEVSDCGCSTSCPNRMRSCTPSFSPWLG